MKVQIFFALFLVSILHAQNMYGSGGNAFVPDAQINSQQFSASTDVGFKYQTLNFTLPDYHLELGLSNTYGWVSDSAYGPQRLAAPLTPSLKYNFLQEDKGINKLAYSFGFNMPYGAYVMAGWSSQLPILQPEVNVGISTTLKSAYALGSLKLTPANMDGEKWPISLFAEGGLASSIKVIGEVQEAFYTLGGNLDIGSNFILQTAIRFDPKTYYLLGPDSLPSKNPKYYPSNLDGRNGILILRLIFQFDGIKNPDHRGSF